MASKKYTLSAALLLLAASIGYGQLGGVIDYKDSSKIKAKWMAQQNEWRNNSLSQSFPARPRNMWQLGLFGGLMGVDGDVSWDGGWNAGISARKALGYVVSIRPSVSYGVTKGLDYRRNGNMYNHPALAVYRRPGQPDALPNSIGPGWYIHSNQTTIIKPAFDFLVSLNNIMFHRKQSKWNVYALVGYSPVIYRTKLDAFQGTNTPYNYTQLLPNQWWVDTRRNIKKLLRDRLDGEYETFAVVNDRSQNFDDAAPSKFQFRHSVNVGAGLEFRLSNRVSLGGEFQFTMTPDDYIDGWHYMAGLRTLTPDKDNIWTTNLHLNFNLGNANKRVAPLWWINPLGYAYGELSNPSIMKFPKPVLDD
ncbi:MAG TPA: hypothetical protein PKD90_02730, partial [Phnomibacter sp.]|nr:hypothetical protein [Phnomibacter sp.]